MGQYLSATVPEETVGKPPSDKAFNQPQAQKEVDEDQEEQQEQEQEEEDLSLIQDKEHDGISSSTEDSPSSQGLETPKQNLLQQRFKVVLCVKLF